MNFRCVPTAMLLICVSATAFGQGAKIKSSGSSGKSSSVKFLKSKEAFFKASKVGYHKWLIKAPSCAPPNPLHGPKQQFVYQNGLGKWKLPSVNQLKSADTGRAKYTWTDGSTHDDQFSYYGAYELEDAGGNLINQGTVVTTWAALAHDQNGNSVFFYFGTEPIINAPQGRRYPMYWSWDAPETSPTIHRFITQDGTTRF